MNNSEGYFLCVDVISLKLSNLSEAGFLYDISYWFFHQFLQPLKVDHEHNATFINFQTSSTASY